MARSNYKEVLGKSYVYERSYNKMPKVSVGFDMELFNKINKIAKERDITFSECVRVLCRR